MEADSNIVMDIKPIKPGVFSSYGNGWRQLWPHFLPLFLIGIIYFVIDIGIQFVMSIIQIVVSMVSGFEPAMYNYEGAAFDGWFWIWALIGYAIYFLFITPLEYGQSFAYLKAARADKVGVEDLFAAFKNFWSAVGSGFLVYIIVIVSSIFLIVPGIYFGCKLAFVPFLVVDRKMGIGEAFRESWRMASHGRAWKVFLLGLLAIPIFILGLICLGVGIIIAYMWVSAAFGSLYHAIEVEKAEQVTEGPVIG